MARICQVPTAIVQRRVPLPYMLRSLAHSLLRSAFPSSQHRPSRSPRGRPDGGAADNQVEITTSQPASQPARRGLLSAAGGDGSAARRARPGYWEGRSGGCVCALRCRYLDVGGGRSGEAFGGGA